ncbi:type II toxin-antitoxin system RelE/ParE family toxin [Arthrobacter sp. GMC3]|uniref:type II toxin-antitoxin system RelE/ParE family toxin n=1 Tax=Arthrobacter sp. GMC3 TaxID=2058894 RepID=UPI002157D290|nr:type II toxin-antitoxin system RelE/ParE family toxin [Arthrobacter sp. GMC3]
MGAALELLAERGPQLGRPLVDTVVRSRHKNMKELRPVSSGCCLPLIRNVRRYCSWPATRLEIGLSDTRRSFRSLITCSMIM